MRIVVASDHAGFPLKAPILELLLAAGIDGPKSLFEYTPESLLKRLEEVRTDKKLTAQVPALPEIENWFTGAKPTVVRA